MTASHPLPHGSVTILFTDVEDSSLMNKALGDALYHRELRDPHFDVLRECLNAPEHNGYENGTPAGDSLMIVFQHVDEALACARAMQERLTQAPITCTRDGVTWTIKIRIGLHRAEKDMKPDGAGLYHGEDINYAKRVEDLGKGGQILVSASAHDRAGSRQVYDFYPWPNRYIKNYHQKPETVHELLWYAGQEPREPGTRWLPSWMRREGNKFIGRDRQIEDVVTWLRGKKPLLTLHGPGGIGKTRLAIQTILAVCGDFRGNIHGVSLDREFGNAPDKVTPELLAGAIARAIEAPKPVMEEPLASDANGRTRLENHLQTRASTLMFLDNGESMVNPATLRWLGDLIQNVDAMRWLVTSRDKIMLEPFSETYEIPGLPVPHDGEDMEALDGYKLFQARVEQHRPVKDISDVNSLRRILEHTAGFPLGIELTAALRQMKTLKQIADGLSNSLLDWQKTREEYGYARADSPRHVSMEACIYWSVQTLPDAQQALFPRLGIFAYDFAPDAAEAICGVADALLVKWNHIHLLESREADDIVRYRLLPVFREYALRRLRAEMPQDAEAIQQQYIAHYVQLIQANGNINIPEQNAILRTEWRNAFRAAELAEQTNDYDALDLLAHHLRDFLNLSVYGAEAVQLQEAAQRAALRTGDVLGQANCIRSLGNIALARSDYEQARRLYEQAQPLYEAVDEVLGQANCIKSLGDLALARSEHEQARRLYEQAQPLYEAIGNVMGQANCIQRLGDLAHTRANNDVARLRYEEALRLYARIPQPYSIGFTRYRLAQVAPDAATQQAHVAAARVAWLSIGFDNLVQKYLDAEFGEPNS